MLIVLRYTSYLFVSLAFLVVFLGNIDNAREVGETEDLVELSEWEDNNGAPLSAKEGREIEAAIDREIKESENKKSRAIWQAVLSVLILPIGFSLWWGIENTVIYVINGPRQKQGP